MLHLRAKPGNCGYFRNGVAAFILALYAHYVSVPPASHFSFRLSLFISFLSLPLQSQIPTHKNSEQKP